MNEIYALVVDNSPVIRRILGYVLEAEGCTAETAEDGLAALDCIARRRPERALHRFDHAQDRWGEIVLHHPQYPELKDIFLWSFQGGARGQYGHPANRRGCLHRKGSAAAMMCTSRRRCDGSSAISAVQAAASRGWKVVSARGHRRTAGQQKTSEIILARMTEGVVELNHQGRIVMANDAALTLFNLPEARVWALHCSNCSLKPLENGAWMEGANRFCRSV
jgi:CheY-like chemotaxis protein